MAARRDSCPALHFWEGHDQDIVVLPSFDFDPRELAKVDGVTHFEERLLNTLFSLRYKGTRLVYVTSVPLDEGIIRYYKEMMPAGVKENFEDRVLFVNCQDITPVPLSQKVLARPRLMQRIKRFLRPGKSFLTCNSGTARAEEIAKHLGCTYASCIADLSYWGTKAGSRAAFAACGIPHPIGVPEVFTAKDLAERIASLLQSEDGRSLRKMVVKLNEGFAGGGNAILDLTVISAAERESSLHEVLAGRILKCFETMDFQAAGETWLAYSRQIRKLGAIAEAFIECPPGTTMTSPSGQVVVSSRDRAEVISTHEQVLDGQAYTGCTFPCHQSYRAELMTYCQRLGDFMKEKALLDHFGVDFVVVQDKNDPAKYSMHALEINLRRGGTTHPHMTARVLCNAELNARGELVNERGQTKVYVASDHVVNESCRGLTPDDLLDIMHDNRLSFSHETQTGAVFHLLGCMSQFCQVGVTCIGNTQEEAQQILAAVKALLVQESMQHTRSTVLPPLLHHTQTDERLQAHSPEPFDEGAHKALLLEKAGRFELDPLGIVSITVGAPRELAEKRVLILCTVHGDETPGLRALNNLLHRGELQAWTKGCVMKNTQVRLMIGNPAAVVAGKRYIDHNLNRLLPTGSEKYSLGEMKQRYGAEGDSAFVLANAIRSSTHVLDIHSASCPAPVHLFPGRTEGSLEIARQCPADFSVCEISYFTARPGTTVSFADSLGVVAVGAEVGQHDDASAVAAAERLVLGFLNAVHGIPSPREISGPTPKRLRCVGVEIVKKGFKWKQTVMPFQCVVAGTVVASDDEGDIVLERDTYIVLPTLRPVPGEEAFFKCEAVGSSVGTD
eukprot:Hpha_TRINITY_DN16246_c0_g1::TRINITY_DN16246_c0_g1_i1::g.12956::m.12956